MKKALKLAALMLAAAAGIAVLWKLFPFVLSLSEPEAREAFRAFTKSIGVWGVLLMLALQILQIIVAIIPGEPLEILFGMLYGTVGGLIFSLFGILIGQSIIFFLVRRYGIELAGRFVNVEKFRTLSFLQHDAKRDGLIFLLFFIPGTPKDVLTWFAPFTGIPPLRFLALSVLARIPSVISSTFAGAAITDGDFMKTLLIFAVTGTLGIGGILANHIITKNKCQANPDKKEHI